MNIKDKIRDIEKFFAEHKNEISAETKQAFLCMFVDEECNDLPQFQIATGSVEDLITMLLVFIDSMRRSVGADMGIESPVDFISAIASIYLDTAGKDGYNLDGFSSTSIKMPILPN